MSDAIERIKRKIIETSAELVEATVTDTIIPLDEALAVIDEESAKEPQVQQWIPCSERLPEDLNDKNIDCFLVTDGFLIWMAYYNSEIGWQFAECTNSRNKIDWTEIIAWQPLPEPYNNK